LFAANGEQGGPKEESGGVCETQQRVWIDEDGAKEDERLQSQVWWNTEAAGGAEEKVNGRRSRSNHLSL